MAQTADQLAAQQKQQADHVRDLMAQQNAARAAGQQPNNPSAQEIDKMVNDRQQVTDDLARLTQQMRTAARELAPTQPAASGKLRERARGHGRKRSRHPHATQLGLAAQRRLLRSGRKPASPATCKSWVNRSATRLAPWAVLSSTSEDAALNRAMDDLSRLRDQLAGLGGRSNSQAGTRSARQSAMRKTASLGQPGQQRQGGQPGQRWSEVVNPAARSTGGGQAGGRPVGGAVWGIRPVALAIAIVTVFGNYDTGNTRISGQAVAPQQGPNPADTQRQIDQGLNLLNQVRAVVQDSPEARQQLQSLIDQMRNLDPSRFPGNPALVEQMHQQLVSGVDALELQLRRQLDENQGGTIRNTDPTKVPAGYQDSVAEYYRKLSGGGR